MQLYEVQLNLYYSDQQRKEWLSLDHDEMTIMDAITLLDNLVDESDPDIDLPNSVHAFQTAERIREAHPDKGTLFVMFHLVQLFLVRKNF